MPSRDVSHGEMFVMKLIHETSEKSTTIKTAANEE